VNKFPVLIHKCVVWFTNWANRERVTVAPVANDSATHSTAKLQDRTKTPPANHNNKALDWSADPPLCNVQLYQRTDSVAVAETLPNVEHTLRVASCWGHRIDGKWDNNGKHTVKKKKKIRRHLPSTHSLPSKVICLDCQPRTRTWVTVVPIALQHNLRTTKHSSVHAHIQYF
jgi:hypothetical protein